MAPEAEYRTGHSLSHGEILALLDACTWPSEAFWQMFELEVLRGRALIRSPALELGCGDGAFTELAGMRIAKGIDLNPRAVDRARARRGVYSAVECRDIRDLGREEAGRYRTLFANSVLEHIPGVERVVVDCARLLTSGGRLVATVPLAELNSHLRFKPASYTAWRARQLQHRNLWTIDQWSSHLAAAGFADVSFERYLDADSCHYWDALDLPASWGVRRYRLGPAIRRFVDLALPHRARARAREHMARTLEARYARARANPPDGCAALIVATKPSAPIASS